MANSPVQRSLRELKRRGIKCGIVERWIVRANVRKDLFGIIDVIALDFDRGVIGVQVCSSDYAAHYRKITEEKHQESIDWLRTPGTALYIHSWRKATDGRYRLREVEITIEKDLLKMV